MYAEDVDACLKATGADGIPSDAGSCVLFTVLLTVGVGLGAGVMTAEGT